MAVGESTQTKNLPSNTEAERAVLGAILLDNSAYDQAAEVLNADDFYLPSHRRLFQSMMDLAEHSHPVDIVTLAESLINKGELESVGGAAYIASLTDGMPRLSNIEHYVRIVRDKALLRRLIYTCDGIYARCSEGSEEIETLIDSAESLILSVGERRARKGFLHFRDIFRSSFESIDALHDRGKRITGLETGFRKFDEMTRGLQPSELIIIAARPSMGKTSLALNIAQHAAIHQKQPIGLFSLEMSREALVLRLLCSEARVDSHKLQSGFASREDWAMMAGALGRLAAAPIFIDDTPAISISEMRAKARRLQREHGLGLLIVDYLQLMGGGGASVATRTGDGVTVISAKFENRTQEVSAISRGLKGLAKELGVPLIAISQLNRAPEERGGRPRLSDLRESGQIEQDADLVAFIYREEIVKPTEANRGRAELIIEKQRNGPTGTVELAFLSKFTCFENLAESFEPDDLSG
ncbi:MAG: replicative DNA helicase [Acidobacteria bacterium]|nr:replicative DNA helicase [Acidobacteriota bacterium]